MNPLVVTVLALMLLAAPTAFATHWTLHNSEIDRTAATTREDDGETFNAPGHAADGRKNRVTRPEAVSGDGSIFLDARMANHVGLATSGSSGVDVFAGALLVPAGYDRDVIVPTGPVSAHHVAAWYGSWTDRDHDRVIDDEHDAACSGGPCGTDEFVWRGLGSGETVAMAQWARPYACSQVVALSGTCSPSDYFPMEDHTDRGRAEQAWEGGFEYMGIDGGLLTSFQSFVLAGARSATGGSFPFDLDDPAALWDVDTFESLNPDAEALWVVSLRAADAAVRDARADVDAATSPALAPVRDLVNATREAAVGVADEANRRASTFSLKPPQPREPNHMDDDYEGRALFDGVPDIRGAYNQYEGYAAGYHFWMDTTVVTKACGGVFAQAGGTSVSQGSSICFTMGTPLALFVTTASSADDPMGVAGGADRRTGGPLMWLRSSLVAWYDRNHDHELWARCDADSAMFDAEAGVCREYYPTPTRSGETAGACQQASLRGGFATVAPLDADWEGALLVRDANQLSAVAFGATWEPLSGRSPVALRFVENCQSNEYGPSGLDTRDAILFATGSNTVALRVETRATLASFSDSANGVSIANESVTDVDLIPAWM